MKSINEYFLTEPNHQKSKGERTDEVVGLVIVSHLLACTYGSILQLDNKQSGESDTENTGLNDIASGIGNVIGGVGDIAGGAGAFLAGLGNMFGNIGAGGEKKADKKDDKKSDKKDDKNAELINTNFYGLLALAKKSNEKEKDEITKKENDSMIKLLVACSFDKDGNEIPFDQRLERMKDALPEGANFEEFKKDMQTKYDKIKDDQQFKKQLESAAESIKKSDLEKFINDSKEEAKKSWEQIEKEKKDQKEIEDKIKSIKSDIDGEPTDDQQKELDELEKQKQDSQKTGFFNRILKKFSNNTKTEKIDPSKDYDDLKKQLEERSKKKSEEWQKKIESEADQDKKKQLEEQSKKELEEFNKKNEELLKQAEQNKIEYEKQLKDTGEDKEKISEIEKSYKDKLNEITKNIDDDSDDDSEELEDVDADDSDLDDKYKINDKDNEDIEKNSTKGSPKPEPPEFEVVKRSKKRGEGITYYKKGDPEKTALGPRESDIVQNAIKNQIIYKRKLAAWKKNNDGTNESQTIQCEYISLKSYIIKTISY